ncbi:UDP-N-acetylmuramate dehydrogenase [uncultured Tessaracoccus sp.]|uniref:UDP-N-acetylmuramate dehydrogenase n=1 Tax=uncultured Tessaracoccus sp. TaxID=905023 RepID=UPI00261B4BCC|nr:UDP-N-acetylmuramate dehydrogenase [uncultured Tessaracoccus sp.]
MTTVSRAPRPVDVDSNPLLADHTTLRVGGPAQRFVVANTPDDVAHIVGEADEQGTPVLVLGGGSNVLVADAGFDGVVVRMGITGVRGTVSQCGGAVITVGAGEVWDDFVTYAVTQEWIGPEALSGIPGSVGATPIQNVGAYGIEVSQFIYSVRTWDRETKQFRTFAAADCEFGYRDSVFKRNPGRWVVVEVTFQFKLGNLSAPILYPELARHLGVEAGDRADSAKVRETVLAIRAGKGMVLDDADHDTWSAGSFFTNPILDADAAATLPDDAPRFPTDDGRTKTSAAWLIQHSGFDKGFRMGNAGLSAKHVLALTNRGGATATELVALASHVRDGVEARTGIRLEPEVNLVGTTLK